MQTNNGRRYKLPSIRTLFPTYFTSRHRYKDNIQHAINHNRETFNNKIITNLSSLQLNDNLTNLLHKGLKFVPTPIKPQATIINQSFTAYLNKSTRNHQWTPPTNYVKHPFYKSSSTNNKAPIFNNNAINFYERTCINTEITDNLETTERLELTKILHNQEITIKPSDKGNIICILDTDDYISRINEEHLQDNQSYELLTTSPNKSIINETTTLVNFLLCRHHIDQITANFLTPSSEARTPILYGLPKIHKENIPMRPIVSGMEGPTDNMAKYITHFINPLVHTIPTYLKDSKTFKQYINNIPTLPHNTILVTADVTSLYTNIPREEGINTTCEYIDTHRHLLPKYAPNTHVFRIILDHILTNSHFTFNNKHYIQKFGTAMGCRMAPPYANIFMHKLDTHITSTNTNINHYKRFIDDIFFIFFGDMTELTTIQQHINELHPTIKFKFISSPTTVDFLDMTIYIDEDRKLATTIYRKPTDCASYLHFKSNHPIHTKRSIIYSQALRYNMLIDDDNKLTDNLHYLTKAFIAKGYPLKMINEEIRKAMSVPQETLIHKHNIQKEGFNNFITIPYSDHTKFISNYIKSSWPHIRNRTQVPPTPPTIIHTRQKNLKDILVHTNIIHEVPKMD